ncbi:energy transducer TonB [Novosphingobium sp. PC22D]|nr:energy transducer TonB [Novosphingobium sp. PC22D]
MLVAAIHVILVIALVRAFTPDFAARIASGVEAALTVTVTARPPEPSPSPEASPTPTPRAAVPEDEGAAAPEAAKAAPREVAAPEVRLPIAREQAPRVAGTGNENTVGAGREGQGTGAGGEGSGTGAGAAGRGSGGGGVASKPVKIAGDINSARDYPHETRDLRIGGEVIVALTVGADGAVKDCRVVKASRDARADRITCRLAVERFRFRPARDAQGRAVESTYGWRQRWYYGSPK